MHATCEVECLKGGEAQSVAKDLAELTAENFLAWIGEIFETRDLDSGTVLTELRLESCQVLGPARHGTSRAPFALLFTGPSSAPLEQNMYSLALSGREPWDIFIVPTAEADGKRSYEAIFS